jgi:hypothetical protein
MNFIEDHQNQEKTARIRLPDRTARTRLSEQDSKKKRTTRKGQTEKNSHYKINRKGLQKRTGRLGC